MIPAAGGGFFSHKEQGADKMFNHQMLRALTRLVGMSKAEVVQLWCGVSPYRNDPKLTRLEAIEDIIRWLGPVYYSDEGGFWAGRQEKILKVLDPNASAYVDRE
jgi:hypothetical protein